MPTTHNRHSQIAILLLLLVTTWLYAHALDFGFIWDDPLWYGRVVGKPLRELVRPMPNYHFYRPTLVLYNRLFLQPNGSLSAPLLHAAQIGWHLLNIVLAYTLSRRLRLSKWVAVAVSGLIACYPFSYQAVAWAAPAQPMAAALGSGALLVYAEARKRQSKHHLAMGLGVLLFLVAMTVQEGAIVLAPLPLLMEWVWYRRNQNKITWWLPLIYPLVAAGFALLWFQIPREAGYTAMTFDSSVALYLLQGLVFPLLGRPGGYPPNSTITPGTMLILTGLTLGILFIASWRARRNKQALFGLAWAVLGIIPVAAGLRYNYVKLASRLFYYSGPGIALFWACALLPNIETGSFGKRSDKNVPFSPKWQTIKIILLSLIVFQSCLLITNFREMYTTGITHLAELVETVQPKDAHLLFINFPDRYVPKRPPYPLGYWGMTLAPASVDLSSFPAIAAGKQIHTTSRRMPPVGIEARDAGSYQIDMRGEIALPEEVYRLAHQMDAVYLSQYSLDGDFALQWVGDVTLAPSTESCQLAQFGETLCLQQAQVDLQLGQLNLTLTWLSLSTAQPHDAVFAHVGTPYQPPIAQDDNDVWLGTLPLNVCQPGDMIRERRIILLPENANLEQCEIRIGVYNRVTGERLPARTPQGDSLLDNVLPLSIQTHPHDSSPNQ
ncbi:MAG: hypothetical protein GY832_19490 [Chloroflexi bacterium]|nr:hypothetical protein [Chloroflexota bacterium]